MADKCCTLGSYSHFAAAFSNKPVSASLPSAPVPSRSGSDSDHTAEKKLHLGINNRRLSAAEAPPHLLSFLRSGSTRANFISMLWLPPRRDRLLHYVVLVKPLRRCQRGVPLSMSTRAAGHRDLDQATIHCLCFSFLSAAGAAADSGRHDSLPPVSDFLPLLGVLVWRRRQTTGRDVKSREKAIKY